MINIQTMIEAFDYAYTDHSLSYHTTYQTDQGYITMGWSLEDKKCSDFCIYFVEVNKELRCHGIFTNLLKHMSTYLDTIYVLAVSNYNLIIIFNKLEIDGHKFFDKGGDYKWSRQICNCSNWKPYLVPQGAYDYYCRK